MLWHECMMVLSLGGFVVESSEQQSVDSRVDKILDDEDYCRESSGWYLREYGDGYHMHPDYRRGDSEYRYGMGRVKFHGG